MKRQNKESLDGMITRKRESKHLNSEERFNPIQTARCDQKILSYYSQILAKRV